MLNLELRQEISSLRGKVCKRIIKAASILPKDIAVKLERFKITRHHVSRRLIQMNRRLNKKIGEDAAEQRGWHWALRALQFRHGRDTEKEWI